MALEVEEIDLTPYRVAGKVALSFTPLNPSEVAVDPLGGPAQVYGVDFLVVGNELVWTDGAIPSSDINEVLNAPHDVTVRVLYER